MSDEQKNGLFSQELLDKFRYFLHDHSSERMCRNLRKVFFDYMRQQHAGLDVHFDTILDDVEALMDFLDICSDETKDWKNKLQNTS
ncbi:hypothetical protein [Polluticoccus soli]|uniref:hypothetical protein n=1 Tax=Polluticoccus soli TaxID=3034150 RepID=UPI0023E15870|nr:hypothetical protein [Flavipsychrobacter sp. JY13-12]